MERINFQGIEKSGKKNLPLKNLNFRIVIKNFIALKCFPIHQVKYIWDMLEIIL